MNKADETRQEIDRIYHTWDRMLAERDVEGALALYAPDATLESPLIPHLLQTERGLCQGTEQLRQFLTVVFQRTPARRRHFHSGYFTDGKRLMWEYPRQTPDGEQMDFAEVMEID
jgi:ketosteroid isomerase-like protein